MKQVAFKRSEVIFGFWTNLFAVNQLNRHQVREGHWTIHNIR